MTLSKKPPIKQPQSLAPLGAQRRQLLQLGAAAGLGGLLAGAAQPAAAAQAKVNTSAHIVILGAGAAGLATASRLAAALSGAKITIIDGRARHLYQPGFTLVAAGIKPMDYVISTTTEYLPQGVELLAEPAKEVDPDAKKVTTESGKTLNYDYLVVATGLVMDYNAIEGMDEKLIGSNGIGSIYHSPEGAYATWQEMSRFADKGGVGVFLRAGSEIKCAGAPLKYTFLTDDCLVRRGTRSKSQIIYNATGKALFSVPIVAEKLRMLFGERNIQTHYDRILQSIDPGKRIATFKTADGTTELQYDFINVVPPMRGPDIILNSPLRWQTGKWGTEGWLEVDKHTLRHVRYPNIFGVGDINGVPKGKTAASVKWQVPVAVDHLVADIAGKTSDKRYDGYTSCPMITRYGLAMLIEFDYNNNLLPSFPGVIAPLEELWLSWAVKTTALKPTYISMLRGQA